MGVPTVGLRGLCCLSRQLCVPDAQGWSPSPTRLARATSSSHHQAPHGTMPAQAVLRDCYRPGGRASRAASRAAIGGQSRAQTLPVSPGLAWLLLFKGEKQSTLD